MSILNRYRLPGSKNNWFQDTNFDSINNKPVHARDKKRLRIAFFVNSFPLLSETFVLNQITGLIDRGHTVDIYATKYSAIPKYHEEIHKYGLLYRTHFLCNLPRSYIKRVTRMIGMICFSNTWKRPRLLLRTLNYKKYGRTALSLYLTYAVLPFTREKPYDIMHCQFGYAGPLALSLKQVKAFDGKLVISFRGVDITKNLIGNPGIYDNVFREADCFLPVSENFKQKLIKEGCDPIKIKVHYSGIDTARFKYKERKRGENEVTNIFSIGRLVEKKGLSYGLQAISQVVLSGRKLTYTIIGDGPMRDKLQKTINLLNLENYVTITGWMTSDEIISKLDNAHILLAPSITSSSGDSEGIPNSSKEAMALGIPVLSTYHSGNQELIENNVSGFLVPERDVGALAGQLMNLIDNPNIWPEIGRAGRKVIESKFEINQLNEELINTYYSLMARNRAKQLIRQENDENEYSLLVNKMDYHKVSLSFAGLMKNKPYIFASKQGGKVTVRGNESCMLGHQIPRKQGCRPDGIFTTWTWNGDLLTVENDRYGFYPVYYSSYGQNICVSPSIARIIKEGAPADLNEDALAVFFKMGYFIGNDTPFRHIYALPPNVNLAWDGNLRYTSSMPVIGRELTDISRDEAIDRYIELFSEAIRRRLPHSGDFAVPLSGGRDSRHILLELNKQGYKPKLVITAQNYPDKQTEDVNIASMLTKELGLEHRVLSQHQSWFQTELKKNIVTNLCSDEHAWLMVVADHLKGEVDTVYDGIAGDSLSESNFLSRKRHNMFKSGNLWAMANEFIERAPASRGFSKRGLNSFLTQDLAKKLSKERAVEHLVKELEKHKDHPNPVNSFTLWNRGRREISLVPFSLLSEMPNVYAPYLDHDLFDFLTTLPIDYLLDGNFHSDTIRRAYPEFSHIPFESKTAINSMNGVNKMYAGFGRELAWYLLMQKPSRYMRNSLLRSALLPTLISKRYGAFTRRFTTMALYLQQLDAMVRSLEK